MKKVTIKNNIVTAVWTVGEPDEQAYIDQYKDFDEQVEVEDSVDVTAGTEKKGGKFIHYIDPQFAINVKIAEIDQETSTKILKDLGATDKLDAVIKQLNVIYANELTKGTASPEMQQITQIVTAEREKGALEKKKLTV